MGFDPSTLCLFVFGTRPGFLINSESDAPSRYDNKINRFYYNIENNIMIKIIKNTFLQIFNYRNSFRIAS